MIDYEEYKSQIRSYAFLADLRKKTNRIIAEKQLSLVMNDTKWLKLQNAVSDLPFLPPYICKCVTYDDDYNIGSLSDAPAFLGDWSSFWEEGIPAPFFNIEWIKVRPRHGKYKGMLVDNEILDETSVFVALLDKYSIPYEEENGIFTIYGYKPSGM